MKSRLLLSLFTLLIATTSWADVEINETNFPDENFRNWLLSQVYGKDNNLSQTEISFIKTIDVSDRNIKSLKGIEYFTALTELYCSDNQLTVLNVSGCTALTQLHCSYNQLAALDVSQNTELTCLDCGSNLLTALDVSGCSALTELSCYDNLLTALDVSQNTALSNLSCGFNQLTALDVSQNTVLKSIDCYNNQLTVLDVSGCTSLTELRCTDNQLTTLDVSGCTSLTELKCYSNQLTTLDVSGCTALTYLWCYQNQISGDAMDALVASLPTTRDCILYIIYDVDEQNVMSAVQVVAAKAKGWTAKAFVSNKWQEYEGMETYIEISEENFPDENFRAWVLSQSYGADGMLSGMDIVETTSIRVNNKRIQTLQGIEFFTALKELYCYNAYEHYGNQLTMLDLSQNTALTTLNCYGNKLIELDLTQNTALTYLNCGNNQLTALDVSGCTALAELMCDNNQLTTLDLSQNTALTSLNCIDNQLTTLDVTGGTTLTDLRCYNNQLTTLDVSKNTALTYLNCNNNQLTALDVSGCTALAELICFNNQLTTLDLSQNTALTYLNCHDNQLTTLDMTGGTTLTDLRCYNNQLTALYVSQNTALKELDCYNNQLTTLDVSQNTALTRLDCYDNQLTSLDVSQNTALTTLSCYNNQLTALDMSEFTALTRLSCFNNQLTALDVSGCTALISLYCYNNQLTTLDVSRCTALTYLYCYQNQINGEVMDALVACLPTTNNGKMRVIYNEDEQNEMTTAQVAAAKAKGWISYYYDNSQWQKYEGVDAYFEISEENFPDAIFRAWVLSQEYGTDGKLSKSEIAGVTSISVDGKRIQTLQGIELFTALTYLNCGSNQLTALDVSKNTALTTLYCNTNLLTALDLSQNTALTKLYCYQNQIRGDAMDAFVASLPTKSNGTMYVIYNLDEQNLMTYVQVDAAKAKGWTTYYYNSGQWQKYGGLDEYIEISEENFPDENFRSLVLKQVYGADGKLSGKEISGVTRIAVVGKGIQTLQGIEFFTALKELLCYNNQLTTLDVSQNIALTDLECYNNQLTALDVSRNTALKKLHCYKNKLTELNLSENNTELTTLYCYQNEIAGTAMDAFVESLPTVNSGKVRVISDKNEQNVMTIAQVAAAKAKGWIPQFLVDGAWKEYSGSDPTGISSIDNGQLTMDNSIYNLAGQRIADGNGQLKMDNGQLKSGIYIVNGKKILVK